MLSWKMAKHTLQPDNNMLDIGVILSACKENMSSKNHYSIFNMLFIDIFVIKKQEIKTITKNSWHLGVHLVAQICKTMTKS